MERINTVFRNGEPLSAEELNGIVRYINELGETIEENQENWSSEGAIEEMWNQLREDDDSKRIHESHSPLHYPLSSINAADLGQPPYSDMAITSDGNGGWQWKKINQGGGGGGSSPQQGINKQRTYFLNVTHGVVPSAPSVNNYNSSPQDNFTNGQDVWTFTNINPTNDQDTYAIWVWFQSGTPVNVDGPIKIFDGAINSSNGEDGEEIEWIYRRVSIIPSETTLNSWENTLANCIGSASAQDGKTFENEDAIPFDWYDNPQGVTYQEKYEYASFRRSVNGSDGKRIWGTTGFCRPFIWSTYGEKGMDGDGIEYIFLPKAEAVDDWLTFGQNPANAVNYPPGWTNEQGFQNNEYFGPEGSSWTDDLQGVNKTTRRYIYTSQRKKVQDPITGISSWQAFSIPILWIQFVENGINGSYVQEVYRNDTAILLADLSNIPASSNRDYPPTGWTISLQARNEDQHIWCMQRTIEYNEYNISTPGPWSTPFRLTGDNGNNGEDGKYMEFVYKRFRTKQTFDSGNENPHNWPTSDNNQNSPNNPQREDYTGPTDYKWEDSPQEIDDEYIYEYVAQRTFNGTNFQPFSNPILWSKYGENGRDGDGVEYIFKGFNTEQLTWANDDSYPPNWATNSAGFQNDDYLGPSRNQWEDDMISVDDTVNKFVYGCCRKKYAESNSKVATWHAFSVPKLWANWGSQGGQGQQGGYTQFIFKNSPLDLSTSGNYNELSTSTSSIPSGWSLTATNPSSSSEYIWGSHRLITYNTSNEAQYGAWITPFKISGNDAEATTVYQLVADISGIRYKRNHAGTITWMPDTFTLQLYKYEGNSFTRITTLPSGYSLRRIIDMDTTNSQNINALGSITTSSLVSYTSNSNTVIGNTVRIELYTTSNNATVALLDLSIVIEYQRMLIPMGRYTNKEYVRTDTTVPLVLGSNNIYYYLDADTNKVSNNTYVDPTTNGQTVWGEATEYEVILTKALFAEFAKLGSFIIYGDYFFSQYGTLYYNNNGDIEETIINGTNYNNQFGNKTPYGWFDYSDPLVRDDPDEGDYKFKPSKGINAKTGEEWSAGGNIYISSSGNASFSGDINASSFTAGQSNNLHIVTTNNSLQFMRGNTTVGRFVIEGQGLQLYLLDNSGHEYKIDWGNWLNTNTSSNYTTHTYYNYYVNNGYVYLTAQYYFENQGEYYTNPDSNSKITTGSYTTYEASSVPVQLYQIVSLVYGQDYSTADPYAHPVTVTELRKVTITGSGPQYGTERLYICSGMIDQMRCDYSDPTSYEIYPRTSPEGTVFVKVGTSPKTVYWTLDVDSGDNYAIGVNATIPADRIVISNRSTSVVYNSYPFGSGNISGMPSRT